MGHSFLILSVYPFFLTAVTVFRKPNAIPLCFSIDLVSDFRCLVFRFLAFLVFYWWAKSWPAASTPNLEDQVIFGQGFLPLALDKSISNCRSAVLVLVHPGYFISPVPTISGERSHIRHLGEAPNGRLSTSHWIPCIILQKYRCLVQSMVAFHLNTRLCEYSSWNFEGGVKLKLRNKI